MRFEEFEPRIVFDQSLGAAVSLNIDSLTQSSSATPAVPSDIQFRDVDNDFEYTSHNVSLVDLDAMLAATRQWALDPGAVGIYTINDSDGWRKSPGHYPPTFTSEGVIVAERLAANNNPHTMMQIVNEHTDCSNSGGLYTQQDYHYVFSFDVRHPESEASWLTQQHWGIVMQLWGPREPGETPRNPPFSIYSRAVNGQPVWRISSFGDSRLTTQSGDFEEHHSVEVPMTKIGDWHRFDIEFVPNPFGDGLIRTWMNGQLVAEWQDIKNVYFSMFGNHPTGPLNPAFGLYSSMIEDGMTAQLDNISLNCDGVFQSSIAGVLSGGDSAEGNLVFATNQATGQSFGTHTKRSGVYALNVPPGSYTVTGVDRVTGRQTVLRDISTQSASRLANLKLPASAAPVAQQVTLTADVNGDGLSDIVNRVADGSWRVSVSQGNNSTSTSTWSQWSTNVDWTDIHVGDFNGDGMQDVVGRVSDGNWWVGISTGDRFLNQHWGKWSNSVTWTDVLVADFNGDGRSDIAGREASSGTWWVSHSTGTSFATTSWGRWSSQVTWLDTATGDFNGDGLADIAGRVASDGNWWIAISQGSRFLNQHFGAWYQGVRWSEIHVGDFNGDGKSDIVGRTDDGNWWVSESTGNRFLNRYFGKWSTAVTWTHITTADVNGDGRTDLVGRASSHGLWWIAESSGDKFQNRSWGAVWSEDEDWLAVSVDDFDGDGKSDLLGATADAWLLWV